MSLFTELKRRNVFRVALLYLVASWIILQVADVGISLLGLPANTGRLIFLLVAIGFPLLMVFSWAYEITPEGLRKESQVDRSDSVTQHTAKKLDTAVIVLLVIGIGALALDRLMPQHPSIPDEALADTAPSEEAAAAAATRQSIAVLPFVNMSADEENGYFSDGLSEELLNLLAKIPGLQVAARTSAFRFKDSDASISEIAEQLNVAHLLEGSVRKSGDDIRITAQLINASDGYHLWSHSWDRTLVDVFAIQDEIAAAVVEALKVSILGELPRSRVTEPEAYSLYLQAKQAAALFTKEGFDESIALLTQALAIDPEYAEAWVELGTSHINMTGQELVPEEQGFARGAAANERALSLDPTSARALASQGWVAMYWEWDFPKAAELIGKAMQLEPGNASVVNAYAVLNSVFGRKDDAISLYEEALVIDPLAMSVLANLSSTYLNADRLDDAAATVERMRAVEPQSFWIPYMTSWIEGIRGSSEAALDALSPVGAIGNWPRAIIYYDLGDDAKSDAMLEAIKLTDASPVQVAAVYAYREQPDEAFEWLDKAYEEHSSWAIEIRMFDVVLSSLYRDPRWSALLEKIGISDADARAIRL